MKWCFSSSLSYACDSVTCITTKTETSGDGTDPRECPPGSLGAITAIGCKLPGDLRWKKSHPGSQGVMIGGMIFFLVLEVRPLHKKEKLKSLRTSTSWLRLGGLDDWLREKIPSRQKGTIEISGMNESINFDSYQVALVMRGIPGSLATKIEMSCKSFWLNVLRKFHQIFQVYPWYVWNVSWVWEREICLSFLNDDSHKNLPNLTNKTGMKADPIDLTHDS